MVMRSVARLSEVLATIAHQNPLGSGLEPLSERQGHIRVVVAHVPGNLVAAALPPLERPVERVGNIPQQRQDGLMALELKDNASTNPRGVVFFEKRNGLMQVAYPIYFGKEIDPGPVTERRTELAKLMTTGEQPQIAIAAVPAWSVVRSGAAQAIPATPTTIAATARI